MRTLTRNVGCFQERKNNITEKEQKITKKEGENYMIKRSWTRGPFWTMMLASFFSDQTLGRMAKCLHVCYLLVFQYILALQRGRKCAVIEIS